MKLRSLTFCAIAAGGSLLSQAQTLDADIMAKHSPAVVRQTYEVCRYVKLTPEQQAQLAKAVEEENALFVKDVKKNDGLLTEVVSRKLNKMRDTSLATILTPEQQEQYWRGVYNAEALAYGAEVADRLQAQYGLTDQNWKFINIAFYQIDLESRVARKMLADKPKVAARKVEEITEKYLATIEEKGGIRVDRDGRTVTVTRPFRPESLRRE